MRRSLWTWKADPGHQLSGRQVLNGHCQMPLVSHLRLSCFDKPCSGLPQIIQAILTCFFQLAASNSMECIGKGTLATYTSLIALVENPGKAFTSSQLKSLFAQHEFKLVKGCPVLLPVGAFQFAALKCSQNGTIVTYGGLSREPVMLPTGPFIFKGLKAQGFWLSGVSGCLFTSCFWALQSSQGLSRG